LGICSSKTATRCSITTATRGGAGQPERLVGLIFNKSQNKFQVPAKLRRLIVDLIDKEECVSMGADVKGDAYEVLLENNAQDPTSGAGQYFTPRPLIQVIVDAMARPEIHKFTGALQDQRAHKASFSPPLRSLATHVIMFR